MGVGQSKFGRPNHQTQYPYGAPGYIPPYPPPQQPFIPGYGQAGFPPGAPVYPHPPQGFIPPGTYGQGSFLPPPQLNWLPQEKQRKRKSRRTQSERFVGGFAPDAPQPNVQPRRAQSKSRNRGSNAPVIPQAPTRANLAEDGPARRAPTPFIPAYGRDEEEEEEEEEDRERGPPADLGRNASRRSHVRYPTPPPIEANIENVLRPMESASTSAFGPTGPRPRTPLRNPLPPPPRDLYEMTPYKSLLTLPQTTALLTATYGPQQLSNTSATQLGVQPSVKRRKSSKGLFRAFSKRDKNKEPEQPRIQFIPVFVPSKDQQPQMQSETLNRSMSQQSRRPPSNRPPSIRVPSFTPAGPTSTTGLGTGGTYNRNPATSSSRSSTPEPPSTPVPPIPSSPPAVRFDQDSLPFSAFLNHSPHRVLYRNQMYPTGTHLYEAMKFMDHRADIAEAIRNCPTVNDVYALSARFQQFVRPDWGLKFLDLMDEVLLTKCKQHPDLRSVLLHTGDARIVYEQPHDDFWGSGGRNELGKALVRVRERLRAESL